MYKGNGCMDGDDAGMRGVMRGARVVVGRRGVLGYGRSSDYGVQE